VKHPACGTETTVRMVSLNELGGCPISFPGGFHGVEPAHACLIEHAELHALNMGRRTGSKYQAGAFHLIWAARADTDRPGQHLPQALQIEKADAASLAGDVRSASLGCHVGLVHKS